ncbi:class I SAM-dependent RNA methyltransferase [Bdellovibrio sp. KM01]|uniref:class I SAM-dependent RNA methyltransferase n=1 Tax=Bdellovibrio sp. KM01 TaxID=2748865 RepID=UPI0015E97FFE|nr:class I SAM-dependent RNA methyltransferase [Bdellovibrio sp. KM01]QLY27176.1 class I SAM-dependent RNA methyltransferase [Bdellovibrio sp. KM01]
MTVTDPQTLIPCPYKDTCSGCQLLDHPYGKQVQSKTSELRGLLQSHELQIPEKIEFLSAGAGYLRDRLDFSLQDGRLGLYGKNAREIVDIEICAQLSPELQTWYTEFRKIKWPFTKGSIRLRVGPEGQRGVWLDFANVDIKALLDEQSILKNLQEHAFVEIGQRRKIPVWNGHEFKLKDPELNVWFTTWMGELAVKLYCHVASFTQPSLKANKLIADKISSWVNQFPQARIIEFGSGIGNLTLPALTAAKSVLACEIDALSLEGLEKTVLMLPSELKPHSQKLTIYRGDFQKKILQDFSQFDGVLANPPRSGLMGFLNPLEELSYDQRPPFFIYMSCFPESMAKDMQRLQSYGYEIKELVILDQFPQTNHYEVLGLLQRK